MSSPRIEFDRTRLSKNEAALLDLVLRLASLQFAALRVEGVSLREKIDAAPWPGTVQQMVADDLTMIVALIEGCLPGLSPRVLP